MIQVEIVNNTNDNISGISLSYYLNGNLYGTQSSENADGTILLTQTFLSLSLGDRGKSP